MRSPARQPDNIAPQRKHGALASIVLCLLTVPGVMAQDPPAPGTSPLTGRQAVILDRLGRLETRMLELSRLLAGREPEKAERLRDALDFAGRKQLRNRMEHLIALLREERLGDADFAQQRVLTDLHGLVDLLTSAREEVDRYRAERERLAALKKSVEALIQEQTRHYRETQRIVQFEAVDKGQSNDAEGKSNAPPDDEKQPPVAGPADRETLERRQAQTHRRTAGLGRKMRDEAAQGGDPAGVEPLERSAHHMQNAADQIAEPAMESAAREQEQALKQLQQARADLEDALRQARNEERQETLAALEIRLRNMLDREKTVRGKVVALAAKPTADWSRTDRLQLDDAREVHAQVLENCERTHELLVDEGTTVIVPELIAQSAEDMRAVARRLEQDDTGEVTRQTIEAIIALLEEILAAIVRQQGEDAVNQDQPPGEEQQQPEQQGLLPDSAELKLLRSSQVRINDRWNTLAAAAVSRSGEDERTFGQLGDRQHRLADLTRRMNERK